MMPEWNFSYLDGLPCRPLVHGRTFSGSRGDGPLVLFVHGGFHGAWCWSLYLRLFHQHGIPAAAVDVRGHGGLAQTNAFITHGVREMAQDVVDAAAALGGDVVLAGHSLGALVAMAAAERIAPRGLVLLAPAAPRNIAGVRSLPPFPSAHATLPPGEERARTWFLSGYGGDDITPYLQRLCPESPALLNDCYQARVEADPAWVKGPALCLSGGRDDSPIHSAGQDEAVAALFKAETHRLPQAGHCLMLDDSWNAGAHLILDWLRHHRLAAPVT